MGSSNYLVEVNNLTKSFGAFKAVDGLSFSVNRSEIFGFLGLNGAGKSTTLRCMLSLIQPDGGDINLFGKPLGKYRKEILGKIGCIVEKPDFYLNLSGRKNLRMSAAWYGMQASNKELDHMLDVVGLGAKGDQQVAAYSLGMKQRLGIAQALIHQPELIILDEPTNGLDPQGIIDVRELILSLKREHGKTVIVSSHILYEIELLADSMLIMHEGKALVQGNVKELISEQELIVTIECDRSDDVLQMLASSKWQNGLRRVDSNEIEVRATRDDLPVLHKTLLAANIPVYSLQSRKKLEDFFLKLTKANRHVA